MITRQDLETVREQIQEDLDCLLDEFPTDLTTKAQQIVCDQFTHLIADHEDQEVFVVTRSWGIIEGLCKSFEDASSMIKVPLINADTTNGVWYYGVSYKDAFGIESNMPTHEIHRFIVK